MEPLTGTDYFDIGRPPLILAPLACLRCVHAFVFNYLEKSLCVGYVLTYFLISHKKQYYKYINTIKYYQEHL